MRMILILAVIATMSLLYFALQFSVEVTLSTIMIAYASANVTGNNETEDVPNLITTPPPLLSSTDQTDSTGVNGTNATQLVSQKPTVLQPQQLRPQAGFGNERVGGQTFGGGNQTQQSTGDNTAVTNPLLKPITKGEAAKAEQEANVMIKAYYEKIKQEEEEKARQEAAALAAARANQTTTENTAEAEESEESEEDTTTVATDQTQTDGEDEGDEEEEDEELRGENEDENQDEE